MMRPFPYGFVSMNTKISGNLFRKPEFGENSVGQRPV
jgi:hypothetical protein